MIRVDEDLTVKEAPAPSPLLTASLRLQEENFHVILVALLKKELFISEALWLWYLLYPKKGGGGGRSMGHFYCLTLSAIYCIGKVLHC
jgi:hypothetical protein